MRAIRTVVATTAAVVLAIAGVTAAVANDPPPRIAFLANGIVPADALAAGPIAGQLGAPIFTTAQDALPTSTADALDDYDPELVIVMGGPVAIADAVLGEVAAATGLNVVSPTPPPTSGIVRAAGQDRFQTAAAAAALLAAYTPAFLPTDMKAADSNKLDGKDSSAFQPVGDYALADQACAADKVVTGIAADGRPTCAADQIGTFDGDADTLDGLDSSAFAQVPSTRTITFTPGSLMWTQDPGFLETSEGLLWGPDATIAAGFVLRPPRDWNGSDVDVTLHFAPLTNDAGDIRFFSRAQSFTEGDTVGDITGVASSAVPSAGDDVLMSQTIVVPSARLGGTDLWRMRFQRDASGADTYPSSVVLLGITLAYDTL